MMSWTKWQKLFKRGPELDSSDEISNLEKTETALDGNTSGLQDQVVKQGAVVQQQQLQSDLVKGASSTTSSLPQSNPSNVELLGWDGEDDPRNPKNWSTARKWVITILISLFTFCTLMTSTLVAPALPNIQRDLHIASDVEGQLVISSFVLSYALGPFIWAPLSEQYGRFPILQAASTWYFIWNLVCGFAHNEATMIVGRVLSGVGGAGALSINPGVLSDCWSAKHRGRSLAVVSLIPLLAPSIGPIIGGQVAQYSTWRWAFWSTSAFSALCQFLAWFVLPETHGPTIVKKLHQQRQDGQRGDTVGRPTTQQRPKDPLVQTLLSAMRRPFHLLLTQPVIQLTAVYSGVSFGVLFIIMSEYALTFEQVYHQAPSHASLNYLAIAIGYTLGAQITALVSDKIYHRLTTVHQNKQRLGLPRPEIRLLLLGPAVVSITTGLFIYAWTATPRVHWIVPNIGMVLFAGGTQASTQCINAYIIDSYSGEHQHHSSNDENDESGDENRQSLRGNWSASAMAGVWALKSLGGFIFPLFGPAAQDHLGFGSAGTLWAVLSLVTGLGLWVVIWYRGEKLRGGWKTMMRTRTKTKRRSGADGGSTGA